MNNQLNIMAIALVVVMVGGIAATVGIQQVFADKQKQYQSESGNTFVAGSNKDVKDAFGSNTKQTCQDFSNEKCSKVN